MSKIFLSHSSVDQEIVRRIAADLNRLRYEVWLDEWEIAVGDSIAGRIEKGLEDARFVVVALSRRSTESRWVDKEWKAAYWDEVNDGAVKILPILLDECSMPKLLADKKYADFRHSYAVGFHKLVSAIEQHLKEDKTLSTTSGNLAESLRLADDCIESLERLPPHERSGLELEAVVQTAISHGSMFYNRGDAEACARLYHHVATQLLAILDRDSGTSGRTPSSSDLARLELRRAVASGDQGTFDQGSAEDLAWQLRAALDGVLWVSSAEMAMQEVAALLDQLRDSAMPLAPLAVSNVISQAIRRGLPLFEARFFVGCAELYAHTARALLDHVTTVQAQTAAKERKAQRVVDMITRELGPIDRMGPVTPDNAEAITERAYGAFHVIQHELLMRFDFYSATKSSF